MLPMTRRQLLCRLGGGFGAVALTSAFADAGWLSAATTSTANPLAPKAPHFPARAKRLIFLFMNGAPSHVDTFDPKPELEKLNGQPLPESFATKAKRKPKGNLLGSPF